MLTKDLKMTYYRPAGNDTMLVEGLVEKFSERKAINDELLIVYPQLEQVGFVSTKGQQQLLMAALIYVFAMAKKSSQLGLNMGKLGQKFPF